MVRQIVFFLFPLILFAGVSFAQDTLVMMNGRLISDVEVMRMDSDYIYYLKQNQRTVNSQGRIKPTVRRRFHVFEIVYGNGTQELAYLQDTADFVLNPIQMRYYVEGCQDALRFSHDRIVGPVCFGITVGGFLIMSPYYVIAIPAIYSGVIAMFTPEFPENLIDEGKTNKYYIMGFQDTKKTKKVKSSVLFGLGGLATGFGLYYLTHR